MAKSRETTHPNAAAFPDGLSGPALRALASARVRSIADLTARTQDEIAELHGMGPKGIAVLKTELKSRGLQFRSK